MDKRGWTYVSSRSKVSLLLGIICMLAGALPLLVVIGVALPVFSSMDMTFYDLFVKIALLVGGIFLLYDSFATRSRVTGRISGASILAGFFLAIVGALPLALHLKLFNFLPFAVDLNIPSAVWYGLLVFYGVYLIFEAFIMRDLGYF